MSRLRELARYSISALLIAGVLSTSGCLCALPFDKLLPGQGSAGTGNPASNQAPPEITPFPPAIVIPNRPLSAPISRATGKLALGPVVQAGGVELSPQGLEATVDRQGDPISGLTVKVPAGSYQNTRNFKVSYAPITGATFKNVNPLTPLITIDNGGGYSNELMTVKIPVNIPPGSFAMAFYYDEPKGTLEGIPLTDYRPDSITIATRHFSSFFVSAISESLLKGNIDSGYKQGVDNWQFENFYSVVINGHCAAMSISSMWYYLEQPDGQGNRLWGRYDGIQGRITPKFPADDVFAIKLNDFVQTDYEDRGFALERNFLKTVNTSVDITYKLFAYSILATGCPQLLIVPEPAHAMVCNRVANDTLFIVDPNRPTEEGQATVKDSLTYKYMPNKPLQYGAVTSFVEWDQVRVRWDALKSGTIGNEKDRYPPYVLRIAGPEGARKDMRISPELADGYRTTNQTVLITAEPFDPPTGTGSLGPAIYEMGIQKVYLNGEIIKGMTAVLLNGEMSIACKVELKPGDNLLGIEVDGINRASKYDPGSGSEGWWDFRWLNVIYQGALSVSPTSWTGEVDQTQVFTVNNPAPPAKVSYEWLVNSSVVKKASADKAYTFSSATRGTFTLTVVEYDESASPHRQTAAATANIAVNPKTTPSATPTPISISPATWAGEVDKAQVFTVTSSRPPAKATYDWLQNGYRVQWTAARTFTFSSFSPGTFTLTVNEYDEGVSPRRITGTATAVATVTRTEALDTSFKVVTSVTMTDTRDSKVVNTFDTIQSAFSETQTGIVFSRSATRYSHKAGSPAGTDYTELTFELSADKKTLVSYFYWAKTTTPSRTGHSYTEVVNKRLMLTNVPVAAAWNGISGVDAAKYISEFSIVREVTASSDPGVSVGKQTVTKTTPKITDIKVQILGLGL